MSIFRWFTKQPASAEPAFSAVHLDFAFACMDCKFVIDGSYRGRCKRCDSQQIFRVRAVLDRVTSPIKERLREVERKKRETPTLKKLAVGNDLAMLTEFRIPPKDAA